MEDLRARHGPTVLSLDKGRVELKADQEGGFWADIDGLRGSPVVPDSELLEAFPPALRQVCETLDLRDPVGVRTHPYDRPAPKSETSPVIIGTASEPPPRKDSSRRSVGAPARQSGSPWRDSGQQLEGLVGNLSINEATILNEPFRDIQGQIEA